MTCTECKVGYCAYRSTDPQRECPIQNGHRDSSHFSMPPQESGKGSIVPEGTRMVTDWSSFRREAAKDILCAIINNKDTFAVPHDKRVGEVEVSNAIFLAEELIRQLKQE